MLCGEHRAIKARRGDFQVVSDRDWIFDVQYSADLVADISAIINIDAVITINIDAERRLARTNEFDAYKLKAQRFYGCRKHLC
ncbi:hypothetical protein SMGES_03530 [Serratia marcescens]|nr:hypothetical protein SMGES_03530 [Serratia marcescens]